MAEKRGKILVIRGGAIGDFILTLPAIAALRETFPNTHLEVLGYPRVAELALAAGIIDAFRSIEARPLARFFARGAALDPEWSAYFESFNVILSYLYDPDELFKTNVGRATRAQFIQAQHRPDETESLHATSVFLKPLEKLAIYSVNPAPLLRVPSSSALSGRWIAAHPGSGSEKKNWPLENWIQLLADYLAEADTNILLVAGEAEGDRMELFRSALPSARIRIAQNLPLSELAALLAETGGFVGHDSGITHLAAALGLPTLVLWGPSNQEIWRPLNPGVRILKHHEDLSSLPVEMVFSELRQMSGRNA